MMPFFSLEIASVPVPSDWFDRLVPPKHTGKTVMCTVRSGDINIHDAETLKARIVLNVLVSGEERAQNREAERIRGVCRCSNTNRPLTLHTEVPA